jgi:FMN reductase
MKATIINGGYSLSSRIIGIEQEIIQQLKQQNIQVQKISVHQLNAQDLLTANYKSVELIQASKLVEESELVFVLTPIFKGSYSGILKTFLDVLPQKALQHKIVVPVAIGGSIAHLLALEYSLKPVLSILGATSITNPVYVVDSQVDVKGTTYTVAQDVKERLAQSIHTISFQQVASL